MELQALSPGSRLWSQAILVLALAAQALPAPYTVIANVQRHVVTSGDGNTIHFPAQVTIQCPNFFGLQCRHQVNDHQVIINVFHGNPDGDGNGILSHVKSVIFTGGRVETSQDGISQFPPNNVKHATEGSSSRGDSAMNDISSGESFNGKMREEETYGLLEKSFEMTTVKENGGFGSFSISGEDDEEEGEEKQTESPNKETEAENTSNDEFNWSEYLKEDQNEESKDSKKVGEEDSEDKSEQFTTDHNSKELSDEDIQEKSGNNDDDATESTRSNENTLSNFNESDGEDDKNTPRATPYTYGEETTNNPNSIEAATSKSLLEGDWWNLGRK